MPYVHDDDPEGVCGVCEHVAAGDESLVVARGATSLAFVPSRQPTYGTTLVVPTRHVLHPLDLSNEEADDLFLTLRAAVGATMTALDCESSHISQYVGALAEEPTAHLHWRLEPRYSGPPTTWTPLHRLEPTARDERRAIGERLRGGLPAADH
ncbi:HIT family protein [Streptomyces sp. NPDC059629]|uniref:HIT family protein n=1 Tax=Streptomyces sp. NPDC059629 TaxID=3346889 RepID=UPI0036A841E2